MRPPEYFLVRKEKEDLHLQVRWKAKCIFDGSVAFKCNFTI